MRVRNKEIRSRRHRKEQVIKAAERALREQYGDKKATPSATKAKSAAPKKAAAPKSK
jgi:type II secretory pathway pseudopilin PulG